MDAFFKYLKEPHIIEDFRSTFDLSAKFKTPQPSEAQKFKYFQEEFNVIFQRFYHYLRQNNTLPGKNDQEVEANIKSKLDQSDLLIEFDSWLESQAGPFVLQDKARPQSIPPIHSTYSNPPTSAPPSKYPITPPPSRPSDTRVVNTSNPFNIDKNDRLIAPPSPSPASNKLVPALTAFQTCPPPHQQTHPPSQTFPPPQRQHQPSMQHPTTAPRPEEKEKPIRVRFIEKLSEYMDYPERMNIIKAELSIIMKKTGN